MEMGATLKEKKMFLKAYFFPLRIDCTYKRGRNNHELSTLHLSTVNCQIQVHGFMFYPITLTE